MSEPARPCIECEDTGTVELRTTRGDVIDISYCSCPAGERLRLGEDRAAARLIEKANRVTGRVSYEVLAAVRAGLLGLDSAPQASIA